MSQDDNEFEEAVSHKWFEGVGFVVFILLFFGPFGIPLLFKSRRFSKPWKWIIAVIVILVTIYATVETIKVGQQVLNYYQKMTGQPAGG